MTMKTQTILSTLLLGTSLLTAQTTEKPVTVKVKKIEIINGVERISDTTYTVNSSLIMKHSDSLRGKVLINSGSSNVTVISGDPGPSVAAFVKTGSDKNLDDMLQQVLKDAASGKTGDNSEVMIMNLESDMKDENGEKKPAHVLIYKKVKVSTLTEEDSKLLGSKAGIADDKLSINRLSFYPNPSSGRFTLTFNLPEKGTTEVSVLNMEGKSIYTETLKDFSGDYSREIDISANPKGVYFIKVKQGQHAQIRKIISE